MKKTTKSTNTTNRGKTRHTKSTKKPVTIDLKAESVTTNTKSGTDTATPEVKNTTNRSVPKVEPKQSKPAEKAATQQTSSNSQKKTRSNSSFGRKPANTDSVKKPQPPTSTNKASTTSSPPSSSTPPVKGQWLSLFAAGIVGGLVVFAGSGLWQYFNQPSNSTTKYISASTLNKTRDDLTTRIAKLEAGLKDTKSTSSSEARLATLNSELDSKLKESSAAIQKSLETTSAKIQTTEEKLNALEEQQQITAKSVASLESSASSGVSGNGSEGSSPVPSQSIEKITAQIENTNSRLTALEGTSGNASVDTKTLAAIATIQAALPKISQTVKKDVSDQLRAVTDRVAAVEKTQEAIPEVSKTVALLSEQMTNLKNLSTEQQNSIASLKEETAKIGNTENQAARSVAAAALKNDIDQGRPFEQSLKNLEQLAGSTEATSGLSKFAESGIPTVASIKKQFDRLGDQIIAAAQPKPAGGFTERLFSGAKSFIKKKPVTPLDGQTPTALVSQISASLTDGDTKKAAEFWTNLPEPSQKVSQEWHDILQARITADQLVSDAVQSYLHSTASQ